LKQEKEKIQEDIVASLKRTKQLSAKFEFATVSRKISRTPKVINEGAVINYLKMENLDGEYIAERFTDTFTGFAKQALKEGLEIPGVEVKETEYISILSTK